MKKQYNFSESDFAGIVSQAFGENTEDISVFASKVEHNSETRKIGGQAAECVKYIKQARYAEISEDERTGVYFAPGAVITFRKKRDGSFDVIHYSELSEAEPFIARLKKKSPKLICFGR